MNNIIKLPSNVAYILEKLNDCGYEAYVVGGCVRNSILGIPAKDYDVTTNACPDEIKAVFSDMKTVDTGIKFGTVTVISDGEPVEVTTYRVDGEYCDNRRPEAVSFTKSLSEDLKRRDFTVNALAYNHRNGLVDIFGGISDINSGTLRAIGDPDKRFNEDGLRILRALRFSACYGFEIEKETADAVHRNRHLLKNIAGERIASEINKLLCGNCERVLIEFSDVFAVIIPEIADCVGFEQQTKYHNRDVWGHIVAALISVEPEKHLRLAMLFHDVGKPYCFTKGSDGVGHFKGHARVSTEIAERVLSELKYDSITAEKVITLVKTHDIVLENREPLIKRCLNRYGEELFDDIISVHIADDMGKAPEYMNRIEMYKEIRNSADKIIRDRECFNLKALAVNGNDLKSLGYSGREVGDSLNMLLNAVIDDKCANEKSALLELLGKKKGEL